MPGEDAMRVMQTFGAPRPTTNPYIVMLRDALAAHPDIEHVPFSWRAALTTTYDVLHVHWGETPLAGANRWTRAAKRALYALLVLRVRLARTHVVRTVHNPAPAALGWLDRRLVGALVAQTDVEIHLTEATTVGDRDHVTIPHGHYRDWFASFQRAEPVPGRLAFVGLIKPYKGVEDLLSAFGAAASADDSLSLTIAGRVADDEFSEMLRAADASHDAVTIEQRYIDDDELVERMTAAELVVLPYRELLNSGVALTALSLDRPVLMPDTDATRMLADEVGPGWVQSFTPPLGADDLQQALAAVRLAHLERPTFAGRDWTDVADAHLRAYRIALGGHAT